MEEIPMDRDNFVTTERILSEAEIRSLTAQNSRLVSSFVAEKLEVEAKKNWDLFYKRNETRFFKDRHWTTREFNELLADFCNNSKKCLLEIGCGVGNLIYPLLDENPNLFIYACDLSPRAVELVKSNKSYSETRLHVFQTDVTTDHVLSILSTNSVDIVTLVFVLSAIHPEKFAQSITHMFSLLKPGGVLLFRDYALHDMAQIRFKPGHKISENLYMRQDGTRSYYFEKTYLAELFESVGFEVLVNDYIQRRTVNKKENIDAARLFLQSKFRKPLHRNDDLGSVGFATESS